MIKKILVTLICILSSCFIVYIYVNKDFQVMKAQSASSFELQKGQKVIIGKYDNKEVVWDIGNNANDYVLMSSKPIVDAIATYDSNIPITDIPQNGADRDNYCLKFYNTSNGDYITTYCPTTSLENEVSRINLNTRETTILNRHPFVPTISEVYNDGSLGLTVNDRAFKNDARYILKGYVTIPECSDGYFQNAYFNIEQLAQNQANTQGRPIDLELGDFISLDNNITHFPAREWMNYTGGFINKVALRPFALLDKAKIMFAADTTYTDGNWHNYVTDTSNLNENNEVNPNKLRIQSSLTATLLDIKRNNHSTDRVIRNQSIVLSVNANTGNNTRISIILFDEAGTHIRYYKMLEPTKLGTNDYTLDLTGVVIGKYKLAVINEEYDASSQLPVESSAISEILPLEIVESHKLIYTKQPQSGATGDKEYEVTKNVNAGQKVGVITVNPQGVMPLTYAVETNGDNSYQNFEIDGLNSNNESSANSLNVKIKTNAPDLANGGLKAGTYKFCVRATDANGEPTIPTSESRVCSTFTVEKTALTIAFADPNMTKKPTDDAEVSWVETAIANPSNGTKISYTKVGGDISLIDIDPDTGAITYQGNNTYGKVKIRATVDDDPFTGYDNYNAAYVEKEIMIVREVDATITPDSASSDTKIPTFSMDKANIKTNGLIGKVQGILGMPDTIGGSITTYQYELVNGQDSGMFRVNENNGTITSGANLAVGSYHFTIKVSDKWSSKEIPVTVNVGMAPAENLKFYENQTSNTMITQKSVKLTDTNVTVYATVKGSSNNNPVTYRLKDGEPTNVIEVNPNSGVVTIKNVGTVVIIAEKQGSTGQANAITELTFTVTTGTQNFIYTDASGNELPKSGDYYTAYKETYASNKTFKVYTTGNAQGTNVTYKLKDGSPMDVISVDSDGTVHILNASTTTQIGKVIVQATSHDPNGNYDDKTIELPINIDKGTRTIAFAENPIYVTNGTGSITPNVLVDGSIDTDGNTTIEIDPSEDSSIAWTNDGETIHYTWNGAEGKDIKLHVTKPANRNYKIAEADGGLHILGADESALTLSTPGKITYGDHFTIRSTQDDSMSTNVQYTFETDNGVFISAPQVNGNKAEFDALAYSGNTEITITVTRTADGELPLSKKVKVKVLPKPITIEIEDKEKKRLEENPPLTYKDFKPQLVTWNGVQDTIDESVIKLSTTAGKYSPIGTYPIIAKNAEKQLNDNYPNYTFTIKDGKLNIKDNGNKDFWDIDDDGCPDLNIKITDEQGNTTTINGDMNEDGIPDYNIDTNGDGKPDLNIDTDNDDRPDINLVILKEWKPNKCVEIDGIKYSSGISAKPEINIDLDGDNVPDINIDNKGDFKPHLNISKDGKTPSVNITILHGWTPKKDYKKGSFLYDSIGTDSNDPKPELNIDTDGDGLPDINLDLDGDGTPDLNVDVDGDWIPDMNIDSTGDGQPDVNVDTDNDGQPDENLMDITEWKPEHNVDGEFPYDTMTFERKKELEDNGVKVEKPDGTFAANITLEVTDITKDKKAEVSEKVKDLIGEQSVVQVFDVKLLENGKEIEPDGILKVKIPVKSNIQNPRLLILNEAGEYEQAEATFEDGYLIYETDKLGQFTVIGDIIDQEPNTNVGGSYYPGDTTGSSLENNMGGALTGDTTNIMMYMGLGCMSLGMLLFILFKRKQAE